MDYTLDADLFFLNCAWKDSEWFYKEHQNRLDLSKGKQQEYSSTLWLLEDIVLLDIYMAVEQPVRELNSTQRLHTKNKTFVLGNAYLLWPWN